MDLLAIICIIKKCIKFVYRKHIKNSIKIETFKRKYEFSTLPVLCLNIYITRRNGELK